MKIQLKENIKYGYMLSGGLDSAILLHLVLESFKEQNIKPDLTIFTIPKSDGAYNFAKQLAKHFNVAEPIPVGDPTVFHFNIAPTAVKDVKERYPHIQHLIYASNKNPPIELPGVPSKRRATLDPFFIMPFFDLYKSDIIKIAEENNLQELYNITHSCTELSDTRCNECWQCYERAWGFKEAGAIDTGTY